jgi:endonuclease YncB( thermonuclease family)
MAMTMHRAIRSIRSALALFALAAFSLSAPAVDLEGRVVRVADGDTLTVLVHSRMLRVRLVEIDAPEKRQAFGRRSGQSLSGICMDKPARIVTRGIDRYDRVLGRVYCAGVDANAEQVRRGMAWVYDRYVTDASLYLQQDDARGARRGLWADPRPVPPWAWRAAKRRRN